MAYADTSFALPCAEIKTDTAHEELYRVGLAYALGEEVETDLIMAHKWFNLAALRGNEDAKLQRQEMAEMMSKDELKAALKSAREWMNLMN